MEEDWHWLWWDLSCPTANNLGSIVLFWVVYGHRLPSLDLAVGGVGWGQAHLG